MTGSAWAKIWRYIGLLYQYKVAAVLQDPQAHRRELLFLLGIFFIILTIIVCLLLLIYFQLRSPAQYIPVTRKDKQRRRFLSAVKWTVPLLTLIILLGIGGERARRPSYCSSCHIIKASVRTWKGSPHKEVTCVACHTNPGVSGYLQGQIRGLNNAWKYLDNDYPARLTVRVDNGRCLDCHDRIAAGKTVSKAIVMSHREVIAAGYRCQDCHAVTGHLTERQPRYSGMSSCLPCHDGKTASSRCQDCHANDPGETLRRLSDFPRVSVEESQFRNCRGCHKDERKCIACHGLELPHPSGFLDGPITHARAAAFGRKKLCYSCHDTKVCISCHNFPGHPDWWAKVHGRKVITPTGGYDYSNEQNCLGCHKTKRFCKLCH